jgi:pimeloyl-ACP methyl ester carboxylesterase
MNAYFISGIGADERMFVHTKLPEGFVPHHIRWIGPLKNESLADYAIRLAKKIDTTQPFILIGLSLGGIMSVEIAKRYQPITTILISSVPLSAQLPPYFATLAHLKLAAYTPPLFVKMATALKHRLFMRSKADREIMHNIIWSGDDHFIYWAMNAVLHWNNEILPNNLYHIHGTSDEVFPIKYCRPTHIIEKANHVMIMSRAEEVNEILREILDELNSNKVKLLYG